MVLKVLCKSTGFLVIEFNSLICTAIKQKDHLNNKYPNYVDIVDFPINTQHLLPIKILLNKCFNKGDWLINTLDFNKEYFTLFNFISFFGALKFISTHHNRSISHTRVRKLLPNTQRVSRSWIFNSKTTHLSKKNTLVYNTISTILKMFVRAY